MSLSVAFLSRLVVAAWLVAGTLGDDDLESNEIWGPELSSSSELHKPSKTGFSFKALIKALSRFNILSRSQQRQETDSSSDTAAILEFMEPSTTPEVETPGQLVDGLLDILPPAPPVEPDKSHRFTHNFRFGYGTHP